MGMEGPAKPVGIEDAEGIENESNEIRSCWESLTCGPSSDAGESEASRIIRVGGAGILSVASEEGGVGRSNIALNLRPRSLSTFGAPVSSYVGNVNESFRGEGANEAM